MIDLPKDLSDSAFEAEIKRGQVIKTGLICHDGVERPHFYITISCSTDHDPLIFAEIGRH
jgi:hypothetical protein